MKELVFERPITKKDLEEINNEVPVKIILKNTIGQSPDVLAKLSEKVTISIKNNLSSDNPEEEITYTPSELSAIISKLNEIDSKVNKSWSNLEKAVYLYISLMLGIMPEIDKKPNTGLKSLLELSADDKAYSILFKELMDRNGIPCRIAKSNTGYSFNELKIGANYYPLDLFMDAKENAVLMKEESRFELKNFLSDEEFYYKQEHRDDKKIEEKLKVLDHSYIQDAIDTVFNKDNQYADKIAMTTTPIIKIKSKELQKIFGEEISEEFFKESKNDDTLKIELVDGDTNLLCEELLEIGKYYPEKLQNITLSNSTSSHIDMQSVVDAIYEAKDDQEITQKEVTPTNIVIESNKEEDFDLDFSKAPEVRGNTYLEIEDIDTTQKITFRNTSGRSIKMPELKGKISRNIDSIEISNFDLRGFDMSQAVTDPEGDLPAGSVLKNGIRLILSGTGIYGVSDLRDISNVISLTVNGIPEAEFNELMNLKIKIPNEIPRLFELNIQNQAGLRDRRFFEEIINSNIVNLIIWHSNFNTIEGLDRLKGQLLKLDLQGNDLSLDQCKEVVKLFNNNPYIDVCIFNNPGINNQAVGLISDETYNYLDQLFKRSGYIKYRNLNYINIPEADVDNRKKEILMDFTHYSMQNVPYYIEDAKIFRELLPYTFNPMMIKDEATLSNYLNDPSNYFEKSYLKDGTLLLTPGQLQILINSGKKIPQNINLMINTIKELDNTTLTNFKQSCDNLGINLTGVRVFDQRKLNVANPEERVFDGIDSHLGDYGIAEYKKMREAIEQFAQGVDNSLSDAEKFAIIYKRLSDKIATYDTEAVCDIFSKEHAIYQSKNNFASRNLAEGLVPQIGFNLGNNSTNTTITNRCVCAGYADILKNALDFVGIEAIMDGGNVFKENVNGVDTYFGGHEWNKIKIDGKWYYADLCWDRGEKIGANNKYSFALRGKNGTFISGNKVGTMWQGGHYTDIEPGVRSEDVELDDYDQNVLQDLFNKVRDGSLPHAHKIDIPADPNIAVQIDQNRIRDEYQRRKNDMYAKFYGNKEYQAEYEERAARYREHEQEVANGGITYRTVQDYAQREEDEKFLILGGYKDALERLTKYEAGDTTVYSGTPDQIQAKLEKDREYVNTRNYTFDQNSSTQSDLATLGKYGETMPYIQRQNSLIKNIGRGILNTGIFLRNVVAPVYRGIGRYVAQPLHRLRTRNRDASPYRNNVYHRMVARRDYFLDLGRQRDEDETNMLRANAANPNAIKAVSHPIRNGIEARLRAIFNAKQGNEAVLRAGAYDIRQNIEEQEGLKATIKALNLRKNELQIQIRNLEREIRLYPNASNILDVQTAISNKRQSLSNTINELNTYLADGKIEDIQTDAVSQKQHAIASKEVNTAKVTVIKGIAKGVVGKYVGPNIKEWLLKRGKTVQETVVNVPKKVEYDKWVDPVIEKVPETRTETIFDKSKTLSEIMNKNSGKEVTGFYSVWGGERGAQAYKLTGNEKITAIFKATKDGGIGFSDKAGLRAPVLTDSTFSSNLLDPSGVLKQSISLDDLVEGVKNGAIDANSFSDMYVSIGDRYWAKASDIFSEVAKEVTTDTGKMIDKVISPGHWIKDTKLVDNFVKTTKIVDNPTIQKIANGGTKAMKGIIGIDSVGDVVENVRKTTTDKKSNKSCNRNYTYDDGETDPIPTSRKEYDEER